MPGGLSIPQPPDPMSLLQQAMSMAPSLPGNGMLYISNSSWFVSNICSQQSVKDFCRWWAVSDKSITISVSVSNVAKIPDGECCFYRKRINPNNANSPKWIYNSFGNNRFIIGYIISFGFITNYRSYTACRFVMGYIRRWQSGFDRLIFKQ